MNEDRRRTVVLALICHAGVAACVIYAGVASIRWPLFFAISIVAVGVILTCARELDG